MSCGPFAVLWDGRCVLKGSIFEIEFLVGACLVVLTLCCGEGAVYSQNGFSCLGGISSGWTACCGKDAVFSREVFFE